MSAWHYWFFNKLTYIVQNSKRVSIRNKIEANGKHSWAHFSPVCFPLVPLLFLCLFQHPILVNIYPNTSLDMTLSFLQLLSKKEKIIPFWKKKCRVLCLQGLVWGCGHWQPFGFAICTVWKWHKNAWPLSPCEKDDDGWQDRCRPFTDIFNSLLVCCFLNVTGLLYKW